VLAVGIALAGACGMVLLLGMLALGLVCFVSIDQLVRRL
jgi:hypothetical protein